MLALPGLNIFSPLHLIVILVIALMLFGNRLPEVARSMGRSINEFKRGLRESNDDDDSSDTEPPAEKLGPPNADDPVVTNTEGQREREPVESTKDD